MNEIKSLKVRTAKGITTAKIKPGATAEQIEKLRHTFLRDHSVIDVQPSNER